MIKAAHSGSALLIILILSTILTITITKIGHIFLFNSSLLDQRCQQEIHQRLAESMICYGIALTKKHLPLFMPTDQQPEHTVIICAGPWQHDNKKNYHGRLTLQSDRQGVKIRAILYIADAQPVCSLGCNLMVQPDWQKIEKLEHWSFDAV